MLVCLISGQIGAFFLGSTKLVIAYNLDRAQKNIHVGTSSLSQIQVLPRGHVILSQSVSLKLKVLPKNIGKIMPT